jgi:hypothetical protein
MPSIQNPAVSLIFALLMASAATQAFADNTCLDFKWDVSKERALFAETPTSLTAGKSAASAPVVVPSRLYALKLMPQDQVAFSATPGKKAPTTPAYAGLATLKIPAAGSYRIAIDLPVWIDVVSNGALVAPEDFQGQHDCSAPHKIVEFELVGLRPFVLQFSNAAKDNVLLTITSTPPRKY